MAPREAWLSTSVRKSTVAGSCHEFLLARGCAPVGLFREPGHSESGKRIRQLSRSGRFSISIDEEVALFIEDRRWDLEKNIEPILKRRGVVLLDRYYHSSIAYQGARGADPDDVRRRNEAFARRADLVVLLELGVDDCLRRIRQARGDRPDLFEGRDALERVCALFDAMEDPEIRRFDATQPEETLQIPVFHLLKSA